MELVDTDLDAPSCAFGLAEDLQPFDSGWHQHNKHQILYSAAGCMHLETDGAQWTLPPQRAAWIAPQIGHRVRSSHQVELRTVYLPPTAATFGGEAPCRVFAVSVLGREMILHAMRWGFERDPGDPLANSYFDTLARLTVDWTRSSLPYQLPRARTPELTRAMDYTRDHLDSPEIERVARAAGMSPRTLARRFGDETHMTWQQWTQTARMLRAMELLSIKGARVIEVAQEVGYRNPGAFSNAFASFAGETPIAFRRQATQ